MMRFAIEIPIFSSIVFSKFLHSCRYHPLPGLFTLSIIITHNTAEVQMAERTADKGKKKKKLLAQVCMLDGL